MPSPRRSRALFLALFIGAFLLMLYNRHENAGGDFFSRTVSGLDRAQDQKPARDRPVAGGLTRPRIDYDDDGDVGKDDEEVAQQVSERLREAEQQAKDLANSKSPIRPDSPDKLIGVGNAAGIGGEHEPAKQGVLVDLDRTPSQEPAAAATPDKGQVDEDHEVGDELDSILRRAPVIIFSKSYCPHSRKAKMILLDKYDIDPRPFVVELDLHPLGTKIQARLLDMTGRGTVPNVLVNGKSIGGGSEMEDLHYGNKLITKIESLGSVGGGKSSKVKAKHAKG